MTTRAALEVSERQLEEIVTAFAGEAELLRSTAFAPLHDTAVTTLESRCREVLHERLIEHARLRQLRDKLRELTRAGCVREAQQLAGSGSGEFSDLEINFVYRAVEAFRRLRATTRIAASLLLAFVLTAAALKLRPRARPESFELQLTTNIALRFQPIPAGSFQLGSSGDSMADPDEMPPTRVRFSRPFWMSETEVTRRQWHAALYRGCCADPQTQWQQRLQSYVCGISNDDV